MNFRQRYFPPGTPRIIEIMVKHSGGLIKNEKQADYVLIGAAILIIILSLILFSSGGANTDTPKDIKLLPAEL